MAQVRPVGAEVTVLAESLDEPTAHWISEGIAGVIIDNYWQTETGVAH